MTFRKYSFATALLSAAVLTFPAWGQGQDGSKTLKLPDYDLRDSIISEDIPQNSPAKALVSRRSAGMDAFLAARQTTQPGIRIVPSRHGIPKLLLREGKALSAASTRDPDDIARTFLRSNAAIFPFTPSEVNQLRLVVRDVTPEATHLVYNQALNGINVFQGQIKFTLGPGGEVIQVASGEAVPELATATSARLRPEDAELAARAEIDGKTLRAPELVIFPLDASVARLAYRLFVEVDAAHLYEILIDAEDGKLLFRHNAYVRAAQARVWTQSPSQGARELVTLPDGWLPAAGTVTTGNNVDAFVDANGNDQPDPQNTGELLGGRAASPTQLFDFAFGDGTVGMNPRGSKAAAVTNLFYFTNIAHDYYYSLGFTEAAGNFQTDNFDHGGAGGDAVIAEAQFGGFVDNAAFAPTPDGTPPRLRMGLFTRSTTSQTDDLDADYDGQGVIHEYGHGVSNRLVGGRTSTSCLLQIQSGALGEGWSDYFAISYFNNPVFGAYVVQDTVHGYRRQSYEGYTFTYEDFGNSDFEVHDDGEIWAAALWDLRKSLGQTLTDRLVINGLKATPCNPSMTDARDAILSADLASNSGANRLAIWTVFAKHGLGYSARGLDGSVLAGTVYDAAYDLPPDLQGAKNPLITSQPPSTPIGVGELHSYNVVASNPNTGVLSFTLSAGPTGMTVSPTGAVLWIASFTGQRVKITVTDGKGGKVVHGYMIPILTHLLSDRPVLISGPVDTTGYAYVDVPAGVPVLQVTLRNGTGDPDLFVADPDGNFESSERDGNNETLSFPNPKPGRWRVEVDGFEAYSAVSLTASPLTPTALSSNTVLKNLSGVTGSETLYRVTIPPGMSSFQISTSFIATTGDVDVYLKYGSAPRCQLSLRVSTSCIYDQKSANNGNNETLNVVNPAPGDWYLDLSAYDGFSGVSLTTSTVVAPPLPNLTISMSHTGTLIPGQTGVNYTITVTNAGPGLTLGFVTVADFLPAGLTVTAFNGTGWTCSIALMTCTRSDSLPASSSYPPITLTVNVAANAPSSVTNTARVSGGGDPTTHTATDVAVVLQPDLAVAKSHTGSFKPGQTGATYSITVTNAGTAASSGAVSVTDSLPTGLTGTAITGTGWTCVLGTLTCTRSDVLASSGSYPPITVTVNVAANAPASLTNTATVSGGGEINTANNTAQDVTVIGGPFITLVANAFGDNPLIAPNMWVEIKGLNLAPAGDTRIWLTPDFVNNQMPVQLDGVSVMVNGKSAYVYFISPTQINILTSPDALSGSIAVQVTNNGVTSNVMLVPAQAQSLSFFEFVSNGGLHYVYGRHSDGGLIGPDSLFPGASTPVKPGESIYIAATGFGPTDVQIVSGAVTQSGNLPAPFPEVKIAGLPATVSFAGLVGVGTVQINFAVPMDAPDGDLALTATYNGLIIQQHLLITVQH